MEKTLVKKKCNVLIQEAEADLAWYSLAVKAAGLPDESRAVEAILAGFRSYYGGLWVGGTVVLTADVIRFAPNAVNRAFHKNDCSIEIPLKDIQNVFDKFGFVTRIIRLDTVRGTVKLRCFGARRFRAAIAQACTDLVNRPV